MKARDGFGIAGRTKPAGLATVNLHVLPAGPLETNAYLLTAPDRKEAVLIDAPLDVWADVEPLLEETGCVLRELWLTHGHFDHMEGAAEVVRATGAKVRAHAADRHFFETPEIMNDFVEAFLPGHPKIEPVHPDFWVEGGQQFQALGQQVEVRHVPGHAEGNVVFYFPGAGSVFVGDSLFAGSVGRTDLPGGSFAVLEKAIREQLYTLPDATVMFPGHGPQSSIGAEKRGNPFVQP